MADQSHPSNPGPERYQRIAAGAAELAQWLMTLHTLMTLNAAKMTPLVVENITALLDKAAALAPRTGQAHPSSVSSPDKRDPGTLPPRPDDEDDRKAPTIDAAIAATSGDLTDAISDARQACKALAQAGGNHPALLFVIAAALRQISACYHTLGQLAHDRTQPTPSLRTIRTMPSPGFEVKGPVTALPSFGFQKVESPVLASPRFQDTDGPVTALPGFQKVEDPIVASPRFQHRDGLTSKADRLDNDNLRGGLGSIGGF